MSAAPRSSRQAARAYMHTQTHKRAHVHTTHIAYWKSYSRAGEPAPCWKGRRGRGSSSGAPSQPAAASSAPRGMRPTQQRERMRATVGPLAAGLAPPPPDPRLPRPPAPQSRDGSGAAARVLCREVGLLHCTSAALRSTHTHRDTNSSRAHARTHTCACVCACRDRYRLNAGCAREVHLSECWVRACGASV